MMEILSFIGILLLFALLFVGGGLLGWLLKGLSEVFSFLLEGCGTTIAWIILGFLLLGFLMASFS